MKILNYEKFIKENCHDEYYIVDYQEIFITKLKEKFPNGLKLYHITENDNIESIMKDGLKVEHGSKISVIHTVLGAYDIGRLSTNPKGYSIIEISVNVEDYGILTPEENTYWSDELMDGCEDGDEEENMYFKGYLNEHPDLIGGDITIYENISPDKLKVIEKDGSPISSQ